MITGTGVHDRVECGSSALLVLRDARFWRGMFLPSCSGEHARAEKTVIGSSIHRAFQQLQAVDLPLYRPCAPRFGEGGRNGVAIALDTAGECIECGSSRTDNPGVQRWSAAFVRCVPHQGGEAACEFAGVGKIGGNLSQLREEDTLRCVQFVSGCGQQPGTAPAGWCWPRGCPLNLTCFWRRILTTPPRNPAGHRLSTAGEPLFAQLSPQAARIAAAFSPTAIKHADVRIERTRL